MRETTRLTISTVVLSNGSVAAFGNMAYGSTTTETYSASGSAFDVVKVGENITIKLYKGTKPANESIENRQRWSIRRAEANLDAK
jgi:hypothetical protein